MPMVIRAWQNVDLEACTQIYGQCFPKPWTLQDFKTFYASKNICAYVALEEGELVGFIIAQTAGQQADIVTLAIHPSFRRKGIAKTLSIFLMDKLFKSKNETLFLEVAQSNIGAFSLYQSLGFTVCGKRQFYYDSHEINQENADVMSISFEKK